MMNPILEKEIRTRMRTVKTPILVTVYLLLISGIVSLFFMGAGGFNPRTAVNVYQVIGTAEYIIILSMVPALTAIAISGERERQTLDLMLCTDISPWTIIFGKIFSSLAFIFFIIVATLPFLGIVFLFGGISVLDIIGMTAYLLLSAFMVSCIGLMFSIMFRKNIVAIIVTYITTSAIFVGTIIMYTIIMGIISSTLYDYTKIEELAKVVTSISFTGNPFYGFIVMLFDEFDIGNIFYYGSGGTSINLFGLSPWIVNSIYMVLVSGLCLFIARLRISKVH